MEKFGARKTYLQVREHLVKLVILKFMGLDRMHA